MNDNSKSRQTKKEFIRSSTQEKSNILNTSENRKIYRSNVTNDNNSRKSIDSSLINSYPDQKNSSSTIHKNSSDFYLLKTKTDDNQDLILDKRTSQDQGNNNVLNNMFYSNNDEEFNKTEESNDLLYFNNTNEEIKQKCEKVFNNFSVYSKEDKSFMLTQQNLIKLLKNVNVIDPNYLSLVDIDILLTKICSGMKRNLNQNQFFNFMIQLVNRIDPKGFSSNSRECSINIIRSLFDPLLDYMDKSVASEITNNISTFNGTLFNQQSIEAFIDNFELDYKVSTLLKSIHVPLKEIYNLYFHYEINNYKVEAQILDGSFNNFVSFCKDFEITPYVISLNQLVCYWRIINKKNNQRNFPSIFSDKKNIGCCFRLSNYALMLAHFSVITFNKINQNYYTNLSEPEKLLFFLEKLENSKGFQTLERKTFKPHKSKITMIPEKKVIQLIMPSSVLSKIVSEDVTHNSSFNVSFSSNNSKIVNVNKFREFNYSIKNKKNYDLKMILNVGGEVLEKMECKLEILKEIFICYSKFGHKINFNKMNISSFIKFLKDCNIVYSAVNNKNSDSTLSMFSPRSMSKSPLKSVMMSPSSSIKSLNKTKNFNCNLKDGRMIESEASLIFTALTGNKNSNNSIIYKSQFDKNRGISMDLNESQKTLSFEQSTHLMSNKSNVPTKMDFNLFLKSFELVASKLYPNQTLDDAVITFIDKDISKLITEKEGILGKKNEVLNILHNLRKDEIIDLIRDIHSFVLLHYENYCDQSGYMNFDQFLKFYKNFSIFPQIVNLVQINNIFFCLADILLQHYEQNCISGEENFDSKSFAERNINLKKNLEKQEIINFDLFLDSLAISSSFIKYAEYFQDHEKILYLIEKMNKSEGVVKSRKSSGSTNNSFKDFSAITQYLKQKYPEYYQKKKQNVNGKKQEVQFTDLFQNK